MNETKYIKAYGFVFFHDHTVRKPNNNKKVKEDGKRTGNRKPENRTTIVNVIFFELEKKERRNFF